MVSTRVDPPAHRGSVADAVEGGDSVLLRAPSMTLGAGDCIPAFVPEDTPFSEVDLVAVSYTRTADEWIAGYADAAGGPPRRATVVEVGATSRSATAAGSDAAPGPSLDAGRFAVEAVEATDLTGLGTVVSERLGAWTAGNATVVVCFDSLTALLRTVDLERAYRFLHLLTARIATTDAVAHFHFDPAAHDDRTVATVRSLFDATLEPDPEPSDGDHPRWTLHTS